MAFGGELASLFLYSSQQLGVMLGVGAETIVLLAYLIAMRDGVIETVEERFANAVNRVLEAGLILIIISGIGVVVLHSVSGEYAILVAPAFLFKWTLIVILVFLAVFVQKKSFPQGKLEMLAGGTWYALFIVHILAPVTTLINLVIIYSVWILGFSLCWYALMRFTREVRGISKKIDTKAIAPAIITATKPPTPKIASLPPKPPTKTVTVPSTFKLPDQTPKPIAHIAAVPQKQIIPLPTKNLPVESHTILTPPKPLPKAEPMKPAPPAVQKINEEVVRDPDESPFLPAIRVMPKTKEDVDKQHRATVVKFE